MHVPMLRQAGRMLPRRSRPRQAATPARSPQKHALGLDPRVDTVFLRSEYAQAPECAASIYGKGKESYVLRTKPTMSFVAFMVSVAMARARSAPSIKIESTWPGSETSRFISAAIGDSFATQSSTSEFLKFENWPPPNSPSTSDLVRPDSAA